MGGIPGQIGLEWNQMFQSCEGVQEQMGCVGEQKGCKLGFREWIHG